MGRGGRSLSGTQDAVLVADGLSKSYDKDVVLEELTFDGKIIAVGPSTGGSSDSVVARYLP